MAAPFWEKFISNRQDDKYSSSKEEKNSRSEDISSHTPIISHDKTVSDFVDNLLIPTIQKKAEVIGNIVRKFSTPEIASKVESSMKKNIEYSREKRRNEAAYERPQRQEENGYLHQSLKSENERAEDLIKDIVKYKLKIIEDRKELGRLDEKMEGYMPYDNRLRLVMDKTEVLKDMKKMGEYVGKAFKELRQSQTPDEKSPDRSKDNKVNVEAEALSVEYSDVVKDDVKEIMGLKKRITDYGKQINDMNAKINDKIESILPLEKDSLIQTRDKVIESMKSESLKLNQLNIKFRQDQEALKQENIAMVAKVNNGGSEMQFTAEERAKYSELLGELDLAVRTSGDSEGEGDVSGTTAALAVGCVCLVSMVAILGLVVLRRRSVRGRQRLYTKIPGEKTLDPETFQPRTGMDSYGSCANTSTVVA